MFSIRAGTPSGASMGSQGRGVRAGLLPFARRHSRMLGRGLLFTCVLVGARLALPLPLTAVVDRSTSAAEEGFMGSAGLLSMVFVSLALLAGLADHQQRLAFAHFAGRTVSDCRDAALARVQHDDGDGSGDLTIQVLGDSRRVKQGLTGVLTHITVNAALLIGVCVALAVADLRLGLVQITGALVLTGVAIAGAFRVAGVAAKHRRRETALASAVHRLVSRERAADQAATMSALRALDTDSGCADIAMTRWENITTLVAHIVLAATAALVLGLGVSTVQNGDLSLGALFAAMTYLLVLHGPAIRFARQVTRMAPLLVSARHLGHVLTDTSHSKPRTAVFPGMAEDTSQSQRWLKRSTTIRRTRVQRSRALELAAAVALVGTVLSVAGVAMTANVAADRNNPAASLSAAPAAVQTTSTSSPAPVAGQSAPPASATPTCRDNTGRFVYTVRTKVDPDGDKLRGVSDAALVQLGHAALEQPRILKNTRLVPFQRPRFIAAAHQSLCHRHRANEVLSDVATGSEIRLPSTPSATTHRRAATASPFLKRRSTTDRSGPTSSQTRSPDRTDIRKQAGRVFCRDLKARGYSYGEAVNYWRMHDRPNHMDADRDSVPCETVYPASNVSAYWRQRKPTEGKPKPTLPPSPMPDGAPAPR